nr:hypothetical protein GCM10020092_065430 [Actinoplanes digitatis]
MKITLVSEGTYPYAMGGVSVWCEQLIKGMPDYRWDVVALTVDGAERAVFPAPPPTSTRSTRSRSGVRGRPAAHSGAGRDTGPAPRSTSRTRSSSGPS